MATISDMDTTVVGRRRKRWPEELKREIVAAAFAPGASVSVVARQYDVNANQVSSWRRRFCEASEPVPSSSSVPGLVPVTITPEPEGEAAATPRPAASDIIEIELPDSYRVRVGSSFDNRALRRVLDVLRRG